MTIRAMFSGVSGLQAHSTWLDVIGNNISNVNTVAYKASRVEFSDQISQQMTYASGPDNGAGMGGVNGQEIGLGTRVQSIQTLFTAGPTENTGNSTDVDINGDGFLTVKQGGSTMYTRAGNLTFDGNGNLVDANGAMVQGWSAVPQYTKTEILGPVGANPALYVTDASLKVDTATAANSIQIKSGLVCPAKATSQMDFAGNLDAALKATDSAHGGMLDLGLNAQVLGGPAVANPALIPFALCTVADINPAKAQWAVGPDGGNALQQIADFTTADPANPNPAGPNIPSSVVENGLGIDAAQLNTYIWDNPQEMAANPPATTFVQNVYDSNGNAREITVMAWQVNDLGDAAINNPAGPNQAAYAWYAFDTTGGAKPATANLLGGTGITELYDRGNTPGNTAATGDLLYFNTDGSLASMGGTEADSDIQEAPVLYIPPEPVVEGAAPGADVSPIPTVGAEIMAVKLDFGTSGILGSGKRDGAFSDAAGTYQLVNGVSTYVPNQSLYVSSQNGYSDGSLQGVSFDSTGTIQGQFSNGQTIALGQLAMARIDNPEGLNKIGGSYYTVSANSGSIFTGTAGANGIGQIVGGALEGSNVDLTTELTNMIIAQRGFEVNAQVITTSNQELQTLVHLGQ